MISVEEAKTILSENIFQLTEKVNVKLINSLGGKLAEDIYSPLDLPPFNQSNMDGYAVRFPGEKNSWKVVGEVKAGDKAFAQLREGEAVRIFTGAIVPPGSDSVIMQEKIEREANRISFRGTELKKGENIRSQGSQIKKGELAMHKDSLLSPAAIGFLSDLGLTDVPIFRATRVAMVITGNELQAAGSVLEEGKVFESNSSVLQAALLSIGISAEKVIFVKDDKEKLSQAIAGIINDIDILLISGGISVGDYDFVAEILKENNTRTLFYKIAQKPGKPLLFGKNGSTFIFGLPGNPASALTCFYEYVYPALRKMQGRERMFLNSVNAPALKAIPKKKGLANFLKAKLTNRGVEPLPGQESFKMRTFADSNAFIYLPMENEGVKAGELVEVHLLPEL